MRFSSIVATFALAASASAWKIPQGTQDGVYKVETLADGSIVHTKIIDASEIDRNQPLVPGKSLVPDGPLSKRSPGQVWCGCGYNMVSGDCDAAVADLKTQLVSDHKRFGVRSRTDTSQSALLLSTLVWPTTPSVARSLPLSVTVVTPTGPFSLRTLPIPSQPSLADVDGTSLALNKTEMTTRRCS